MRVLLGISAALSLGLVLWWTLGRNDSQQGTRPGKEREKKPSVQLKGKAASQEQRKTHTSNVPPSRPQIEVAKENSQDEKSLALSFESLPLTASGTQSPSLDKEADLIAAFGEEERDDDWAGPMEEKIGEHLENMSGKPNLAKVRCLRSLCRLSFEQSPSLEFLGKMEETHALGGIVKGMMLARGEEDFRIYLRFLPRAKVSVGRSEVD